MEALKEYLNSNQKPNRKKLIELINDSELPDEVKDTFKNLLSGMMPQLFGVSFVGSSIAYVFIFISFGILFFFGYKLYKSIKDKEIKKEEKKKQKQMKKKK